MSPIHFPNGRRVSTTPIPRASGSKSSTNGRTSTKLATSTSPSQTSGNPRGPPLRSHTTTAAASTPAATGIRPRVDRVQHPDGERGRERLRHRAPQQVAARPGQRHLHRERQRQHGERQRQHVRVQVAEQERERRELVDRVRDHARRREPVVVAGRIGGAQPRAHAGQVAEDRHQRGRHEPREHRPAARRAVAERLPRGRPQRAGERVDRGRGQSQQQSPSASR